MPPGTYDVVFSLSGFKMIRREGIVLQGTFTAQVNGDLQVGALEETITVSGASPTVDVVNNMSEFVANRDILDAIPTPIRNAPLRALLLPGTQVTPFVLGQYTMSVHGSASADTVIAIDGMRVNNLCGSGQYSGFYMNDAAIEEVTFTTGAESAEMQNGGLRINSTPKDGGNTFSGTFFAYGASSGLQADNRSDEVKPLMSQPPGIAYTYQVNPSFGGPIVRNKLWFYFTYKYEDNKTYVASSAFPDGSRAFRQSMGNYTAVGRVTWQASARDKVRFYIDRQFNGEFYNGFNTLPTTSPGSVNRRLRTRLGHRRSSGRKPPPTSSFSKPASRTTTSRTSRTTGRRSRPRDLAAPRTDHRPAVCRRRQHHSALHELDEELQLDGRRQLHHGIARPEKRRDDAVGHQLADVLFERPDQHAGLQRRLAQFAPQRHEPLPCTSLPCPIAVAVSNGPTTAQQKVKNDFGLFVQDTWTIDQLTLNLGGRFDHFNAEVPAQSAPASNWIARATSRRSRTCRTGTTGRFASPAPTTCSAPARRRSRRTQASTSPQRPLATPPTSTA